MKALVGTRSTASQSISEKIGTMWKSSLPIVPNSFVNDSLVGTRCTASQTISEKIGTMWESSLPIIPNSFVNDSLVGTRCTASQTISKKMGTMWKSSLPIIPNSFVNDSLVGTRCTASQTISKKMGTMWGIVPTDHSEFIRQRFFGRDAFHRVPNYFREDRDDVEIVPTVICYLSLPVVEAAGARDRRELAPAVPSETTRMFLPSRRGCCSVGLR